MVVLLCSLLLAAEPELSLERTAKIQIEQQKAQAEVSKRFGNKKSSELSQDERKEMVRAQAEAERKVLEQNGLDAKTWERQSLKRSREDFARQQEAKRAMLEAEKKQAEASAAKRDEHPEAREVVVQKGISEDSPAVLEEKEGPVTVEQSLPSEATKDEAEARDGDRLEGDSEPATPTRKPKRGR